jgi:molybdopterin molybdotransferase
LGATLPVVLSFEEALERVLQAAPRVDPEVVPSAEGRGRVLSRPLIAKEPLPPFDYSAMDGYALRVGDLLAEGGRLPVQGESRTGHAPPALRSGSTCRIFTGARIPQGADAVVMQEDVERDGSLAIFSKRPELGAHIRRAGEDLPAGAPALEAGTRLGAFHLGLLAALDQPTVEVARRPRVGILATGDELRAPGAPPREGAIPESNTWVLSALAQSAGAVVLTTSRVGDDAEETQEAIRRGLDEVDLLVTIGGVSVGDHDVVRPALERAGVTPSFWKVAIKPGKPLLFGRAGQGVVLGLPGNPASAQVTFALFGMPLLRAMQGDAMPGPVFRPMTLTEDVKQRAGRRGFYRARTAGAKVTPLRGQSSGSTVSMARADALLTLPATSSGAAAGDLVEVLPFEAL